MVGWLGGGLGVCVCESSTDPTLNDHTTVPSTHLNQCPHHPLTHTYIYTYIQQVWDLKKLDQELKTVDIDQAAGVIMVRLIVGALGHPPCAG